MAESPAENSPEPVPDVAHSPAPDSRGAGRKTIALRLDPAIHAAIAKWASDDLRSVNAQIEVLLRRALGDAGRSPATAQPMRGPGRPRARPNPNDPNRPGGAN